MLLDLGEYGETCPNVWATELEEVTVVADV